MIGLIYIDVNMLQDLKELFQLVIGVSLYAFGAV